MDLYVQWLFIQEVCNQCEWAAMAYRNIQPSLGRRDVMGLFFAIHGFLSHAAIVSKLLDPPNPQHRYRGKALRRDLGVRGPLALGRGLRNMLEHYDEMLDEWATSTKHHHMVDLSVLPRTAVTGVAAEDYHRNLAPGTLVFSFRGRDYDLPRMAQAVEAVREAAEAWLGRHSNPWG